MRGEEDLGEVGVLLDRFLGEDDLFASSILFVVILLALLRGQRVVRGNEGEEEARGER